MCTQLANTYLCVGKAVSKIKECAYSRPISSLNCWVALLVCAALTPSLLDVLVSMSRFFPAIFPGSQMFALFHLLSTA